MEKHLTELDAEIAEMEKALLAGQDNKDTSDEPEVDTQTDTVEDEVNEMELDEAGDADITPSETESDPEPKPKKRISWKKRYTNLNNVHAAYKHQVARELTELQNSLTISNTEIARLKQLVTDTLGSKDVFTEAFSQEDIDVLGEDTVATLKKATENVVAPIQAQLEAEQAARASEKEQSVRARANQAQNAFLERLGALVPDYIEVDSSPQFLNWMREIDPASGYTRETLFKQAEGSGDVGRVANFMLEFKSVLNPLESKITPTTASRSNRTPQQAQVKKPMVWTEIEKFYDDVTKGRFRGRETERREIEAKIEKQIMLG